MIALIPVILFFILSGSLTWYFLAHDRGQKEPVGALWAIFGFGFLGAVAAIFLEIFLLPNDLLDNPDGVSLGLFVAAMGIGIIEEACKFVPAALYIYKKRYFNEHIDGIIYFAIAGLGFGLPENISYTIQFGLKAGLSRLVLTPFFHAATTALVGYYLIRSKLNHESKGHVVLALLAAMLLHGLYDFGLLSGIGILMIISVIITLGFSISLFVLYAKASRTDQEAGISAIGHNAFCRSCGVPNPKHKLYCNVCGIRA